MPRQTSFVGGMHIIKIWKFPLYDLVNSVHTRPSNTKGETVNGVDSTFKYSYYQKQRKEN